MFKWTVTELHFNIVIFLFLLCVNFIIIYMKKFLDCDWLREMQFSGNTVQKKGN